MTCYIYREKANLLIGPFETPTKALEHREEFRDYGNGLRGRPRVAGTIISAEEAIELVLHRPMLRRTTPDQDLLSIEMEPERVTLTLTA